MNNESSSDAGGSSVQQDELSIKVKLIDGQEHQLQIPRHIAVAELRERVAALTEVDAANQRLIYRGRVLKDEHTIADYNVDTGHVIHMVVRVPGSQTQTEETAPGTQPGQQQSHGVQHSVMMGAINIPDYTGVPDINQIVAGVLNSMGLGYQMGTQPAPGAAQAGSAPAGTATQSGEQGPQVQLSEVQVQFETSVPMAGAPTPGTMNSGHPRVAVHRQPMPNAVVTMNRFVDTIETMLTALETGNAAPDADPFSNPAAEPAARGTQPEVRVPAVVVQSGAVPMNLGAVNVVVGIPAANSSVATTASTGTSTVAAPSVSTETATASGSDQQGAPSVSAPASTPASAPTPPRATYGELGNLMARVEQLLVGRAAAALGRAGAHLRNEAHMEVFQRTGAQSELQRVRRIVQYLGALLLELGRATTAVNLMAPAEQRLLPDRPTAFIAPAGNHVTIPMPITFGDAAFGFNPPVNGMPHPPHHIAVHIQTMTSDAGVAPHGVPVPNDNPAVPTGAEAPRPAGATPGVAGPAFVFRVDSTGAVSTSATGARAATGTATAAPAQTAGTGAAPAPQLGGDAQRAQAVLGAVAPLISMAFGRVPDMNSSATGTQTAVFTSSSTASQTVASTAPATTNTTQAQAATAAAGAAASAQPAAQQPAGLGIGALPMRMSRRRPSAAAPEAPHLQPASQPTPSSAPLQATPSSAQAPSETNVALGQVMDSLRALQGSSAAGQPSQTNAALGQVMESLRALQGSSAAGQHQPPPLPTQPPHQTAPQQRPPASGQLDLSQMLGALNNSAQGGGLGNIVGQLAQALGAGGPTTGGSTTTSSAAAGGNIGQLVSQMVNSGALDGVMQQLMAPQQAAGSASNPSTAAPDLSSMMTRMMPMVAQLFGNANNTQAQSTRQQPAGVHQTDEPISAEDADGVLSEEERREWNAVVARDLQAQAAMGTPRPLSDAYLSGSPAKRQRVSGSHAENGDPGATAGEYAGTSMEELD